MRAHPLTAAERARLPEFVQKWTGIGLSTKPVDDGRAERALCRLYRSAGLAEPRIVWAPCPMTAMLSAIAYLAIRVTGRQGEADDLVDRIIRFALIAIAAPSTHRPMRLAVGSSLIFSANICLSSTWFSCSAEAMLRV